LYDTPSVLKQNYPWIAMGLVSYIRTYLNIKREEPIAVKFNDSPTPTCVKPPKTALRKSTPSA